MLDQETKKRIDDCRSILVGKVPDPKSQVEQITIAMIYKFMYDMDKESIDMGGVSTYFVGEYEKYSWANIFNPRIGGNEMIELYSEGIDKMNLNPNIPQLFRDIFKNAYLPYRDPETLKLFLKGINEFHYSHSEKLGDAFEYLLSVLGSQGDAGQFRTPRHIIDFIVELLQPKKNERILDPACGTSGFLISSYKHILRNNTKKNLGDLITPDERKKLVENISGYDISPDMVRLSLVNLYLHNFSNPKIYEYDTLTSEDKWNEYYDVITANPPFMSPRGGGIKPHKRFTIQSNRAEVLFVDYIIEHLTPKGRSGIVVPEGIIFQSGSAYKTLRKTLVEKYLVGVISLPSGVFQPYSGVKTSILILDKELSQKTDKIFFGKIDNDGYDLGAQRREIEKNDLPILTKEVNEYLDGLRKGKIVESEKLTFVQKEQILSTSDIGLSYDRYTIKSESINGIYEIKLLNELCEIYQPKTISKDDLIENGEFLVYGANGIIGRYNQYNHEEEQVLITCRGATCGYLNYSQKKSWITGNAMVIKPNNENVLNKKYLLFILKGYDFNSFITGSAQPQITRTSLEPLKIPLPPIEVQQEIVRELEQYQKIIDGAKQVVDNYKPVFDIDPSWDIKEMNKICDVRDGTHDSPKYVTDNGIPFITQKNITKEGLSFDDISLISIEDHKKFIKRSNVEYGDIIISMIGANRGMCCIVNDKRDFSIKNVGLIKPLGEINQLFLLYYLKSPKSLAHIELVSNGGAQSFISLTSIRNFPIPIPPLEIQQSIVERIETERQIIEGNKKLIEIYTKKIQDRINKLWGE